MTQKYRNDLKYAQITDELRIDQSINQKRNFKMSENENTMSEQRFQEKLFIGNIINVMLSTFKKKRDLKSTNYHFKKLEMQTKPKTYTERKHQNQDKLEQNDIRRR